MTHKVRPKREDFVQVDPGAETVAYWDERAYCKALEAWADAEAERVRPLVEALREVYSSIMMTVFDPPCRKRIKQSLEHARETWPELKEE